MTAQQATAALTVTRVFDASPAVLFDAFTDPAVLSRWFGPAGTELLSADAEARVGGRYAFVLRNGDEVNTLHGEYVEVARPDRLVFTWMIRDPEIDDDTEQSLRTLVTITFTPAGDGKTAVSILHEALPTEQSAAAHKGGWTGCLESLHRMISNEGSLK